MGISEIDPCLDFPRAPCCPGRLDVRAATTGATARRSLFWALQPHQILYVRSPGGSAVRAEPNAATDASSTSAY